MYLRYFSRFAKIWKKYFICIIIIFRQISTLSGSDNLEFTAFWINMGWHSTLIDKCTLPPYRRYLVVVITSSLLSPCCYIVVTLSSSLPPYCHRKKKYHFPPPHHQQFIYLKNFQKVEIRLNE